MKQPFYSILIVKTLVILTTLLLTSSQLQAAPQPTQFENADSKSNRTSSQMASPRMTNSPVLRVPLQEDDPEVVTRPIRAFGLGGVTDVAFSPDDQYALVGSGSGFAVIIHLGNKTYDRFFFAGSWVNSVTFSPDGTQVLMGNGDGIARLWDVQSGQLLYAFEGHTSSIRSVAFSPDFSKILTGASDDTVKLWDVNSRQLLYTFEGHTQAINSVVFSPDSSKILTGSDDSTAKLWDVGTRKLLYTFEEHELSISSVAFSSDGTKILAGGDDGTARLWNIVNQQLLGTFSSIPRLLFGEITSVAFSPDTTKILTGDTKNTVTVWNISDEQVLQTFEGHTQDIEAARFSSNGDKVLTGSHDSVKVWNVYSGNLVAEIEGRTINGSAAFSPDEAQILTVGSDGIVRLWDVNNGQLLHSLETYSEGSLLIAFSPDGVHILVGSSDGTAKLWDIKSGQLLHSFEHTDAISSVAFSPNGNQILTGSSDGIVRLWDVNNESLLNLFDHRRSINSVAFSPNGVHILAGSHDNTAKLWDINSGQLLHTFEIYSRQVNSVAFSPDGTQILINHSSIGTLWDAENGQFIQNLYRDGFNRAFFVSDKIYILTYYGELWDANTDQLINSLGKYRYRYWDVAVVSPSGTRILTSEGDNTAYLWPIGNNHEINQNHPDIELDEVEIERELAALSLSTSTESTLTNFNWQDFSIDINANQTLLVEVTPQSNISSLGLYSRFNSPTGFYDQWTKNRTIRGTYELVTTPTRQGTYYLSVFGSGLTADTGSFQITARLVDTHLSDISPRSAGNVGSTTLNLSGVGFVEGMGIELRGTDVTYEADLVTTISDTELSARFDLDDTTLNTYSVWAIWPDGQSQTLDNVFEIVQGRGPELHADLIVPQANRRTRSYTARIQYENRGNADMPAPLFILSSEQDAPLKTPCQSGWQNGPVQLLGVNPDGPADVLPPDSNGQVAASFQGIGEHITLQLSVMEASDTLIDWDSYKDSMRPSAISLEEWNSLWPTLITRISTTWDDYLSVLGRNAEQLRQQGQENSCVADLLAMEITPLRTESIDGAVISGLLRHATTQEPLAGVSIVARINDGSVIRSRETDSLDGRFVLDGLPDGTYEFFVEGYYFDPSITIDISNGEDVTALVLEAQPIHVDEPTEDTPPEQPDAHPSLTVDENGIAHMVWQRGGELWYARYTNDSWVDIQGIPNAIGTDPVIRFAPALIDGNTAGVAVAWKSGTGNDARLHYAQARLADGSPQAWTEPVTITEDIFGDSNPALTIRNDGELLLLWLQRDWSIQDDTDLYFMSILPTGISDTLITANAHHARPLADRFSSLNIPSIFTEKCLEIQLKKGKSLPSRIPIIGGRYGFEIAGKGCLNLTCDPSLSGNLGVEIALTDIVKGSGSVDISGSLRTDQTGCKYVFNEASIALGVSISAKIPVIQIPVKLKQLKAEVGANVSGEASGPIIWKGGNFPNEPNAGHVDLTASIGPYGTINFFDLVEATVRGDGSIAALYEPPNSIEFKEWCLSLKAEAQASIFTYSWEKKWGPCAGIRLALLNRARSMHANQTMFIYDQSIDDDVPIESILLITIDPQVGTGNIYEGTPVLSSISTDLHNDGSPAITTSQNGEILAAWTKDSAQPEVNVGSAVVVATYNGAGWDAPIEIQDANHFNRQTALTYDANDVPMVVWASAPANDITLTSVVTDAIDAMQESDILFARRVNGVWNTPDPIATLPGTDNNVQIAADNTGAVMAAWLHSETDSTQTIYTSLWNGSAWSTPVTINIGESVESLALAYMGNNVPLLTWIQGTDADVDTTADLTIHHATWNGNSWSAPQLLPKPTSMDELLRNRRTPRRSNATQLSLPKPPDECCEKCPENSDDPDCDDPEPPEPTDPKPIDDETSESVEANDPNEKISSPGIGITHIISPGTPIQYTIYFENVVTATAPAQEVFITDQLSINLDWNTISFEEIAFDQTVVAIDDRGGNQFHTRQKVTDYRSDDDRTWWVDATGILDPATGLVEWTFRTLDPLTDALPEDALAGFLPPNDESGRGEGHVTFSIYPKENIVLGTEIYNHASIIFDLNDAIVTNEASNVIDTPPAEVLGTQISSRSYLPFISK